MTPTLEGFTEVRLENIPCDVPGIWALVYGNRTVWRGYGRCLRREIEEASTDPEYIDRMGPEWNCKLFVLHSPGLSNRRMKELRDSLPVL